ncbi:MAG: RNA 3'-terminal phosphate cyclase, partial [Bradymonadaceae bacterium]
MGDFHEIDGSRGEGGGQILRNALSLALAGQQPIRIEHIRDNRSKPGLRYQHMCAAEAAAVVSDGELAGAEIGSRTLEFRPGELTPNSYRFDVGTAGSAVLVLQTLLPPMVCRNAASEIVVEGGTHNRGAPLFEFLNEAYIPQLDRMDGDLEVCLLKCGFYPKGGGRIRADIQPGCESLESVELVDRGDVQRIAVTSVLAHLPDHIARREIETLEAELGETPVPIETRTLETPEAECPGNALIVEVESDQITEVFTEVGEQGLPAETVASRCAERVRDYLASGAPVGPHLADQLLLPMAMAGGGKMRISEATTH